MTKDGSNARKKAARELAATEQIPYTQALRRTGQCAASTAPAGEENIAPAAAGRAPRARVTPPAAALTTDVVLIGHTGRVESVAFHPDGHTLASGGDVTARLWDLATRQTTTVLTGETDVYSVAFSPDGYTLAVAAPPDKTVSLWTIATGQVTTLAGADGPIQAVAFSPDGRTLASSPDGRTLATGSSDKTVRLWDLATGQATATLTHHGGYVLSVAFSPDGRALATATDDIVQLWDLATGQATATLFGHTELVWSVAFSPDGHTLASGSMDKTVRLWTLS